MRLNVFSRLISMTALLACGPQTKPALADATETTRRIQDFTTALDSLADEHKLPGLSCAVVHDGEILWSGGFGYADLDKKIPADADTPYRLASLSKPIAAAILMQLVQEKRLVLDSPMSDFAIHAWFEPGGGSWAHYPSRYADRSITVRHVLTHTSESTPPGDTYKYSGNLFADLTWVVEDITRLPYPTVVEERILAPLGMTRSSPGQLFPQRQDVAQALATPYRLQADQPLPATYPGFGLDAELDVTPWHLDPAYRLPAASQAARRRILGDHFTPLYSLQTAAGMIASVADLALFDAALDTDKLVSASIRAQMFTPARSSEGRNLPYGLGWFVEEVEGEKIVWHYGWFPPTVSALYVKIPDRRLTLVLLSNCDRLSADVSWTSDGVRASPFARLFLDSFAAD